MDGEHFYLLFFTKLNMPILYRTTYSVPFYLYELLSKTNECLFLLESLQLISPFTSFLPSFSLNFQGVVVMMLKVIIPLAPWLPTLLLSSTLSVPNCVVDLINPTMSHYILCFLPPLYCRKTYFANRADV